MALVLQPPIILYDPDDIPHLPPGSYHSSVGGMIDDGDDSDIEALDEAPEYMRKKKVVIDLLSSDGEDEVGEAVAGPCRLGGSGKARTGSPSNHPSPKSGSTPKRTRLSASTRRDVTPRRLTPGSRHNDNPIASGSGAEPTMSIMFDDEETPQEVPLGWGGLGVQDQEVLASSSGSKAGPSRKGKRKANVSPVKEEQDSESTSAVNSARRRPLDLSFTQKSGDEEGDAEDNQTDDDDDEVDELDDENTDDPLPFPILATSPLPPKLPGDYIPQILEILPDLCPIWALDKLTNEMNAGRVDNPAAKVLEMAFEAEGGYPVAVVVRAGSTSKGSGRRSVGGGEDKEAWRSVIYRQAERTGPVYEEKGLGLLNELFPNIPISHIRLTFKSTSSLLVPTYFVLRTQSEADPKPYQPLKTGRNAKGKGRALINENFLDLAAEFEDDELDENPFRGSEMGRGGRKTYDLERRWLADLIKNETLELDAKRAKEMAHAEILANGGGIECGCCFGEEVPNEMVQCADGHLFCKQCTTMHTETKLGEQKHVISCMDTSGCLAPFPDSELTRLLPSKSLELYHRLKQASELESAQIDGLETCPHCPFSAIIDNPHEKLFRCLNEECGEVSCRKCKMKEHLPKTCEEMEADRKLDKRHVVEDAMSEALIRRCPQCQKPFIKDSGCNKIRCSKCHAISCYICRKTITDGYAHFDQNPADYRQPRQTAKCILWDKDEAAHDEAAVNAARDAAQIFAREAAAAEGLELAEADLNIPAAPAPVQPGYIPIPAAPMPAPGARDWGYRPPILPVPYPRDPRQDADLLRRLANMQQEEFAAARQPVEQRQRVPQFRDEPLPYPLIPLVPVPAPDQDAIRLRQAREQVDVARQNLDRARRRAGEVEERRVRFEARQGQGVAARPVPVVLPIVPEADRVRALEDLAQARARAAARQAEALVRARGPGRAV